MAGTIYLIVSTYLVALVAVLIFLKIMYKDEFDFMLFLKVVGVVTMIIVFVTVFTFANVKIAEWLFMGGK